MSYSNHCRLFSLSLSSILVLLLVQFNGCCLHSATCVEAITTVTTSLQDDHVDSTNKKSSDFVQLNNDSSTDIVDTERQRSLQGNGNCINNDVLLKTAQCIPFTTFLQNLGMTNSIYDFPNRLTIPCGQCVSIVNDANYNYIFRDGLDIQGKLVIDCHSSIPSQSTTSTTSILLQSTAIIVQGQLIIDGTCKPIDGKAIIQINMIDKDAIGSNTTFVPIYSDIVSHCGGTVCDIGQKSITVAGGSVYINGIPDESMLTWVKLYDVIYMPAQSLTQPMGIILKVDDITQITTSWSIGSTLLITSFTSSYNQFQQVRQIVQISSRISNINDGSGPNSGYVDILLNQPFTKPTTVVDEPNYAVEVALLSRNILLTSTISGRDLTVGGHFWIFFTHTRQQTIQGIDLQNFGQQGILGRYPIHIHHCQNLTSSQIIIRKNTIRQSQQRCIVIHGSNNVHVSENIAYDTFGHCFMLEDGIEVGNTFYRNLGALTKVPKFIIPTSISANNGIETDDKASTFWITNPLNQFDSNVAAGSANTGFWFELLKRGIYSKNYPNINPTRDMLSLFTNNIAHSNYDKGIRTYPSGYRPDVLAKFTNLKVFRNAGQGLFFHLSSNIQVSNSIFADNGMAIDLDRTFSPAIRLTNITIIGETDNYRINVRTNRLGTVCRMKQNIGVEVKSWTGQVGGTAYTLDGIQFAGFDHGSCSYVHPISFESEIKNGTMMFDSYTKMSNVTFGNIAKTSSIDYCRTQHYNVTDVYVTDTDGSLKPKTILGTVKIPASVVSLQSGMLQFLDMTKCTNVPSECLSYCQDTCFRGIVLEVDPSFTEKFTLKICTKTNPTKCVITKGHRRTDNLLLEDDSRYFPVYVPIGVYEAIFLNEFGQVSFPSFVRKLVTDVTCPKLGRHDVIVREPPVTYSTCIELIRNGNIDMSPVTPTYWLAQGRGLGLMQLYPFGGVDGTNALISVKSGRTIFIQFLDTRCLQLMIGAEYTLSAQIKLLDPNGLPIICNSANERCPEIGIFTEDSGFQVGSKYTNVGRLSTFVQFKHEYDIQASMNASTQYDDYINTMGDYDMVGTVTTSSVNLYNNNGFQTLAGKFRITNELVQKAGIRLYIQSFKYRLVVDNVSMRLSNETIVSTPTAAPITSNNNTCANMVANSDMELGYLGYWTAQGTDQISIVQPGYQSQTALKYTKSNARTGPKLVTSVGSNLNLQCMTATTTQWIISAQIQLIKKGSNNIGATCALARTCPALVVIIKDTLGRILLKKVSRSYVAKTWSANAFNLFQASIQLPTTPTWRDSIGNISIGFGFYSAAFELILDNFVIQPM